MAHTPVTGPRRRGRGVFLAHSAYAPGIPVDAGRREAHGPGQTLPRCPGRVRHRGRSGGRGDLDLAADDLLLVVLDLRLDVVDVATGRRVVDAPGLEVVDVVAGEVLALAGRLEEVEDRDVDLLDHRGEDDRADVRRGGQGL